MCWYSQHERANTRRAIEGEELIVQDFPNQGRWLASADDLGMPVCIQNGCKLRISNFPKNLQKELKLESEAVGEFREVYQRNPDSLLARIFLPPRLCFDVVTFANGRCLEVSRFVPGMTVDVLSPAVLAPVGEGGKESETERIYV
jgi:hypothetical protein